MTGKSFKTQLKHIRPGKMLNMQPTPIQQEPLHGDEGEEAAHLVHVAAEVATSPRYLRVTDHHRTGLLLDTS